MKILFIYNHDRSFVKKDIELLQKHYSVDTVKFSIKKMPYIKKRIKKSIDVVYCWFASYHSYHPIKWARKYDRYSIVIVGGYDASNIKGYGIFSSKRGRFIANSIYKNACLIAPVDESLKEDILKNSGLQIADKIKVVPTGYDQNRFYLKGKKKDIVLTVCYVDETNWWRKGLMTFVEVANKMPEIKFVVVGKIDDNMKDKVNKAPKNVLFTGWVSDKELLKYYQDAKVYCQLSKYEGLPNVLCEAMLCECIPIGTKANGIPNAIGDTGFYVPYGDANSTCLEIKKALETKDKSGKQARDRIINKFSLEKREEELVRYVGE